MRSTLLAPMRSKRRRSDQSISLSGLRSSLISSFNRSSKIVETGLQSPPSEVDEGDDASPNATSDIADVSPDGISGIADNGKHRILEFTLSTPTSSPVTKQRHIKRVDTNVRVDLKEVRCLLAFARVTLSKPNFTIHFDTTFPPAIPRRSAQWTR